MVAGIINIMATKRIETPFDIVGGTGKSEYVEFDPSLTLNMYLVSNQSGINKKAFFPTPGLSEVMHFNNAGGGRLQFSFKDKMYCVVKDAVYQVNKSLHSMFIGNLGTETGFVDYDFNETQFIIVDGTGGWVFDYATAAFEEITSPNFPIGTSTVTVFGNRAIVNKGSTKEMSFSASGDFKTWGEEDFFSMDASGDIVVRLETLGGKLFILGEFNTETQYDAGQPVNPFREIKPTYDYGCAAAGSVSKGVITEKNAAGEGVETGVLVWASKSTGGFGGIVATTGGNPFKISDESIYTEIRKYKDISDATSYIYENEIGHTMYTLNLTVSNKSWMYDFNTNRWYQLGSKGENRHYSNTHAFYQGKNYVLDYAQPKMYEMSKKYGTDAGIAIKRMRITQPLLAPMGNMITLHWLTIWMKQGTGTVSGPDTDPMLRLEMSRDGGINYGSEDRKEIGETGYREMVTQFENFGQSRSFVLKIIHYHATPLMILGCTLCMDIAETAY